jgi:hypothetical protein
MKAFKVLCLSHLEIENREIVQKALSGEFVSFANDKYAESVILLVFRSHLQAYPTTLEVSSLIYGSNFLVVIIK